MLFCFVCDEEMYLGRQRFCEPEFREFMDAKGEAGASKNLEEYRVRALAFRPDEEHTNTDLIGSGQPTGTFIHDQELYKIERKPEFEFNPEIKIRSEDEPPILYQIHRAPRSEIPLDIPLTADRTRREIPLDLPLTVDRLIQNEQPKIEMTYTSNNSRTDNSNEEEEEEEEEKYNEYDEYDMNKSHGIDIPETQLINNNDVQTKLKGKVEQEITIKEDKNNSNDENDNEDEQDENDNEDEQVEDSIDSSFERKQSAKKNNDEHDNSDDDEDLDPNKRHPIFELKNTNFNF